MKRTILATVLSLGTAGQAVALSCAPVSVASSFEAASTSEAIYAVAVGRVRVLPGQTLPGTGDDPDNRKGYSVEARFDGKLAAADGFTQDAAFPVTVQVDCAGAWCGGIPVNRTLAFIERREEGNFLVSGPCTLFAMDATPVRVAEAEACLAGGPCEAPGQD